MTRIHCFKAYDVRGRVPEELNEDVVYRIGRAYAAFLQPRRVAVGRDIRNSSSALTEVLTGSLIDSGVDVVDIGVGGTEMVYYATFSRELDGGIMVTASHNPPNYNGMKFVREGARPISASTGLKDIRELAERAVFEDASAHGVPQNLNIQADYVDHLVGYIDPGKLRPLKIVGQRRQRRRRAHCRPSGAAPAVRVHQGSSPARRFLPQRRTQPHAGGEPACDSGDRVAGGRGCGDRLGWGLRPLFPFR